MDWILRIFLGSLSLQLGVFFKFTGTTRENVAEGRDLTDRFAFIALDPPVNSARPRRFIHWKSGRRVLASCCCCCCCRSVARWITRVSVVGRGCSFDRTAKTTRSAIQCLSAPVGMLSIGCMWVCVRLQRSVCLWGRRGGGGGGRGGCVRIVGSDLGH